MIRDIEMIDFIEITEIDEQIVVRVSKSGNEIWFYKPTEIVFTLDGFRFKHNCDDWIIDVVPSLSIVHPDEYLLKIRWGNSHFAPSEYGFVQFRLESGSRWVSPYAVSGIPPSGQQAASLR
jgi:hypothetical protein